VVGVWGCDVDDVGVRVGEERVVGGVSSCIVGCRHFTSFCKKVLCFGERGRGTSGGYYVADVGRASRRGREEEVFDECRCNSSTTHNPPSQLKNAVFVNRHAVLLKRMEGYSMNSAKGYDVDCPTVPR